MNKFIAAGCFALVMGGVILQTSCRTGLKAMFSEQNLSVKSFGAIADGVTLNTLAFQKTIDACAEKGGIVNVPAGKYVIGTIILKSNITLHLEEGAELLGSTKLADYSREITGAIEGPAFDECLIFAEDAENIKITGKGVIDGRGHRETFPVKLSKEVLGDRPMLIRFVNCKNVLFTGVTMKDAASWCTHMVDCDDMVFKDLAIDSHVNTNNDGFDLDGCKNILIENCTIRTGDDAICPKSTTTRLTENMVVRNCRVTSNTSAFKTGTSSRGGFKNILIEDCDFSDTRMGAIKLLTVDGGTLEDITIRNIVMNNVEGPLFIRLGNRGRKYDKPTEQVYKKDVKSEGVPPGSVKNIHISNIEATVNGEIRKRQGIMISGIPGHKIQDVTLENINVVYDGGGTTADAKRVIKEDVARYPEQFFFGMLPAWGAYIRHAENITFNNVNMSCRAADARPQFMTINTQNVKINGKAIQ